MCLNVVEVTVVGLNEVVLWKLEVDLEVLLGPDCPHAVDGGVVRAAVLQSVGADVGGADKVLGGQCYKTQFHNNFNHTGD
jgi:hypothetical protein